MREEQKGRKRGAMVAALLLVALGAGVAGFWLGGESAEAERSVIPPMRTFFLHGEPPNRYLSFAGSWEIEGPEKVGFKAASVEYICREDESRCSSADTTVYKNTLSLDLRQSLDAAWTSDRVTIEELGGECRTAVTVVDLQTEEVTQITRDRPDSGPTCGVLPPLVEPRRAKLISGFDRYFDEKFPNRTRD